MHSRHGGVVRFKGPRQVHPSGVPPQVIVGGVALALGASLVTALLLFGAAPFGGHPSSRATPAGSSGRSAQGDQLYTFTLCTAPGGASCLNGYGGINTPLQVGTVVGMEFFSDIFCTTPITGTINWGVSGAVSSQTIESGDCQCSFGPFTHTYQSAGSFPVTVSDTCDGSESAGTITVTATPSFASPGFMFAALGGLLGLVGLVSVAASFRGARPPTPPMPAPVPPVANPAPAPPPGPAVGGTMSVTVQTGWMSPGGVNGVTTPNVLMIPRSPLMPPEGWPAWAFDYRHTVYSTAPVPIQGWGDLVLKTPARPAPPDWPFMRTPAPPTQFPGVFAQPRINPQTGNWSWWNPVDGSFPWG